MIAERWVDSPAECPSCGGLAEPEADDGGELRYWSCSCGYDFGYHRVASPAASESCSLGVGEDVRRRFSSPPRESGKPVFVGTIGRRPQ